MSSNTVKHWQVICLAENKLVNVYSPDTPSMCPNDHPDRSIDKTRVVLLETISNDRVEVVDSTEGQFQHTTLNMAVPSNVPGSVSNHDFSWPIAIKVWKTNFVPSSEHIGDEVDVIVDPNRDIGTLQQNANIGDTELYLNAEVFDYPGLMHGVEILLDNTVSTENVGRLIGYDRNTFKIVIENPLTQNFAIGTKFCLNSCMVKQAYIDHALIPYTIGQKGFSGLRIPANTVMRIVWKNNNGQSKNVHFTMEYNYQ
jgi:hypothetical protein